MDFVYIFDFLSQVCLFIVIPWSNWIVPLLLMSAYFQPIVLFYDKSTYYTYNLLCEICVHNVSEKIIIFSQQNTKPLKSVRKFISIIYLFWNFFEIYFFWKFLTPTLTKAVKSGFFLILSNWNIPHLFWSKKY